MQESAFDLLSEFYTNLWGQLDALSDEHRWIRSVGEAKAPRSADDILTRLGELSELPGSVELQQLCEEYSRVTELRNEWIAAIREKRSGPYEKQKEELLQEIEAKLSYLQDRALAFNSLTA